MKKSQNTAPPTAMKLMIMFRISVLFSFANPLGGKRAFYAKTRGAESIRDSLWREAKLISIRRFFEDRFDFRIVPPERVKRIIKAVSAVFVRLIRICAVVEQNFNGFGMSAITAVAAVKAVQPFLFA